MREEKEERIRRKSMASTGLFQRSSMTRWVGAASQLTRPDTLHKMRLVCVLFTFENNTGHTDLWTDLRTAHLKII